MSDDLPRHVLSERTGRHVCIRCLADVALDEYLRNDYLCDSCAAEGDYPLASTPEPRKKIDER
jgi:hypothetical protein